MEGISRAFSPHGNFWHNPAALPLAGINPRLWRFGSGARGKDPEATHLSKSEGRGGSPSGPKPQAAKPPSNDFPREGACQIAQSQWCRKPQAGGRKKNSKLTREGACQSARGLARSPRPGAAILVTQGAACSPRPSHKRALRHWGSVTAPPQAVLQTLRSFDKRAGKKFPKKMIAPL